MKIPATTIALCVFCLGMMIVPAAAADRDTHGVSTPQIALQPAASSADAAETGAANCLLPGQIRRFGGIKTVTPRRAITLPTTDCVARGGEPIANTTAGN
jgi:hypothetical protein